MPIRRDIPFELQLPEVLHALSRGRRNPSWLAAPAGEAIDRSRGLCDPVIVYDWVDVALVNGAPALVNASGGGPTPLGIGPHAHLLAEARQALVSVNSIGGRLDAAVHDLRRGGNALAAYLLDCVGVMALGKVADAAARIAEDRARELGWGVGFRISPGSLEGWPIERQSELCGLLPLAEAGIILNESGLLAPFKSASGLIGIGPNYRRSTAGSVCGLCRLRKNCWRKKS